MADANWERLKDLFAAALEHGDADRVRFLDEVCGDPALRAEIQKLLDAHARAGGFLESPAAVDDTLASGPHAAETPLVRGTRVGPFEVLERLGAGGMGVVYAAYHPELARKAAIKLLNPDLGGGGSDLRRARLLREAQAMARLAHPNVITVYDVGTIGDDVYLAMELIEGQTLSAWLAAGEHAWREVVAAFVAAGRGLTAAHAAGLVHRDFKPDNVLVGKDGRVCVTDFGLARPAAEGATSTSPAPTPVTTLTATGAVLGTPAYMSPEQLRGEVADARTDQYAFCVSLFEALYGKRPFEGDSVEALRRAAEGFDVRHPSEGQHVPSRIRRALLRGLRPVSGERFESMDALLRVLSRDPRVVWRRAAVAAVIASLVAVSVVLYQQRVAAREVCRGADQKLAGVWNPTARDQVRRAFLATGKSFAHNAFARVSTALDEYASAWAKAHESVCEATRVRGEQSETLLERRMFCLEGRRQDLSAIVATLWRADADVMTNAGTLVARLGAPARCQDPDLAELRRRHPIHNNALHSTSCARKWPAWARSAILENTSRRCRRPRRSSSKRGKLAYRPTLAEALLLEGELLEVLVQREAAAKALEQAVWTAEGVRHHEVAAKAATLLIYVSGHWGSRFEDAERWGRHARAAIERMGDPPLLEAKRLDQLGTLENARGRFDQAEKLHERAIAIFEKRAHDRADLYVALGNLGMALIDLGRNEDALAAFEKSLASGQKIEGPAHPSTGAAHNNLGMVLSRMGRLPQAVQHYEDSIRVMVENFGEGSPRLAATYHNIGKVYRLMNRHRESLVACERARQVLERSLGPEHRQVAYGEDCVGNALWAQKRYKAAAPHYARALAIRTKTFGPRHLLTGLSLTHIGENLLGMGKGTDAVRELERAVDILSTGKQSPQYLAQAQFALAQALRNVGRDRARARTMALAAREGFRQTTGTDKQVIEVDAWLAKEKTP